MHEYPLAGHLVPVRNMESSDMESCNKLSRRSVNAEMVCKICSDLLKEPKMLACAHSFCKECLISLYGKNCKSPSTGLQYDMDHCFEEDFPSNKIECPDCLQCTVLPDHGAIEGLSTHRQLEKRIASLSPEEQKTVREKVASQQKVIANITQGVMDYTPGSCALHERQHQYFCTDCNVTTCGDCLSDDHALHQCYEISQFLVDSYSQLQSLVQPACEYVSRADVSLKKLNQDYESIQANRNVCKEAVGEVFDKMRAAIDQREKTLWNRIDKYIDEKLAQVSNQKQNLSEVQDELLESILEIQQILNSSLSDISLVVDKQRLLEDVDMQEQNILDIENFVSSSMFSSTYIGFRNDETKAIIKDIDTLITLCEFYPDEDTGYYSSRAISMETEDTLLVSTRPGSSFAPGTDQTLSHSVGAPAVEAQHEKRQIPTLKRSQSTPNALIKEKWLMKKRTDNNFVAPPMIPIRYDSLLPPTPVLTPDKVFSKLTASKTEIVHPCGICMGENGSYIISDMSNHCLRIIANNGKFIGAIGKEGKGSGQFEEPSAVAINEKAQIFVCQRENPRIQKFTSGGKYVQKFGHKSLRGNSIGEPWGIVFGPNDKIYVTDWDKSCIHIFYSNGRYDCTIGNDGSILGESLKFPAGIAVDASGNLVVADRGNHCIWVLDVSGNILTRIGSKGCGPGELYLPYGIAIHPNGSIIVSETGNHRISVFSSDGKFLRHFGQKGSDPGKFSYPKQICITPNEEVVVADEFNQRLQLFKITYHIS